MIHKVSAAEYAFAANLNSGPPGLRYGQHQSRRVRFGMIDVSLTAKSGLRVHASNLQGDQAWGEWLVREVFMKCEIEFLPVGSASKAGDAIVVRYGEPHDFSPSYSRGRLVAGRFELTSSGIGRLF